MPASTTQPLAVLADYVRSGETPVVFQAFTSGRGWSTRPATEPLSRPLVRWLARRGVTSVAVTVNGRAADSRVSELLAVDRRPRWAAAGCPSTSHHLLWRRLGGPALARV